MNSRSVFNLCAGSLVALILAVGCDNSKSSQSQKPVTVPPSNSTTAPPSATPTRAPTQTAAVPASSVPTPARTEEVKPVVQTPPPEPPQPTNAGSDDERREQAANLIYAQIRVKMEEAIDERAKLLKSGTDPADPKVRELEGRIMRARELLTGNGEVVEEVEPPIVQKATP